MVENTVADRPARQRIAKLVTEVCSPAVVVVLLSFAVAWYATDRRLGASLLWAVVVVVFSSLLPMVFIVRGARRGRWDGHHVRNRDGRLLPLSLCLVSTAVGLAILFFGYAPRDMVALDVAMLVTLAACIVITTRWKISLHAAVAGGAVAMLTMLYGPWLASLIVVVAVVGWSRVELADHTVAQVIVGAVIGPVLGGVVFLSLR